MPDQVSNPGNPAVLTIPQLFITATDTGVGKTRIATLILQELHRAGVRAAACKPVCSGAVNSPRGPVWEDLEQLHQAGGGWQSPEQICRQRFLAPLAPPVAAALEGRQVATAEIDRGLCEAAESAQAVVVEGAGGWLCPLTEETTLADWVTRWRLPVLIVARPGLGTINHTLLTIESIRNRQLPIRGIIFNDATNIADDRSVITNAGEIEKRSGIPVLGELAFGSAVELRRHDQVVRIDWLSLMRGLPDLTVC